MFKLYLGISPDEHSDGRFITKNWFDFVTGTSTGDWASFLHYEYKTHVTKILQKKPNVKHLTVSTQPVKPKQVDGGEELNEAED